MRTQSTVIGTMAASALIFLGGAGLANASGAPDIEPQQAPTSNCGIVACEGTTHGYQGYADEEMTPALRTQNPTLGDYKTSVPSDQSRHDSGSYSTFSNSGGYEAE